VLKINCFIIILLTLLLFTACGNETEPEITETTTEITTTQGETTEMKIEKEPTIYNQYADEAVTNLIANYWNSGAKIFYDGYPSKKGGAFNYWWYAHAVDLLADVYIRTQNAEYLTYVDDTIDSIIARNNKITNDYFDDMEWMAIAILRLYDETKDDKYLNYAQILWKDIQRGWNDKMGGGIAWRKGQLDYKNTPANAPAAILAARLYKVTNDEADLEWAVKIYTFQKDNLVDPATGQVWDGINREGNGKIDKNWNFTYCHGVYIGAGVEMYNITGDATYLNDAVKTTEYALGKFIDKNGVFSAEGDGDGGLFKGILIRYLGELYKILPEMTQIKETINKNVDILRENGTNNVGNFTNNFNKAPADDTGSDLSTQLSGCMLFEVAVAIN
jgi:Predicted glycosyl hydrolase